MRPLQYVEMVVKEAFANNTQSRHNVPEGNRLFVKS